MIVKFTYNEDKDIECLISKGGGSSNSPGSKTKTYQELLVFTDHIEDNEKVKEFVRNFIKVNNIHLEQNVISLQNNWNNIADSFEKRAENIFNVNIPDTITAYLTITGRFPYRIDEKYFYVSAKKSKANATAMHELWHFYTWHRFGKFENGLGHKKYNDLKESLTVILNIEFSDLMSGEIDSGYSQHQDLRDRVANLWGKTKNIGTVWDTLAL